MKKKVVIGLSGGVDSSVAAYILKNQGFEVIGITMKVWDANKEGFESTCCGLDDINDARLIANKLDIPYYVLNFKELFKEKVINYFISEYVSGKTPNPCIACNRHLKWDSLFKKAILLGADYIATGHYARVFYDNISQRFTLRNSIDFEKDQTYVLYDLKQDQLKKTLMPLGEYTKTQVRKIASDLGFGVANKKDSQEICFIPNNDYRTFIRANTTKGFEEGDFVDLQGKYLAKHSGICNYTIGQRKGLGASFGMPMYVNKIIPHKNQIVLSKNEDLYSNTVFASNLNFVGIKKLDTKLEALAKIRYNHKPSECNIEIVENDVLKCSFLEPQRAITPGQAIVLYRKDNNTILCGGVII